MKLFTMKDVYKKELDELTGGWDGDVKKAESDWDAYMISVVTDHKKYHPHTGCDHHEELCMWCHYLALIRDLGKEIKELECMDFNNKDRPDCQDCLKEVKYWYKRLI